MLLSLIILFLALSALFSGTEIAFVSANKLRVELKKKKGTPRAKILAGFYDNSAAFIGTLLVGNNIALVVFTSLVAALIEPALIQIPLLSDGFLLLLVETLIVTVVILIFGEFLPKTLFRLYADESLYLLAYPLKFIQWVLFFPSWLMTQLSNLLLRAFRMPLEEVNNTLTRLDLEDFINHPDVSNSDEATIDRQLFGKALNLRDVKVRECMVPRTEIENIDVTASVEELEQLFNTTKLSRLIITDGDIDNVLGYVHHQQLLEQPQNISRIIMKLPFIPEVMRVTDLMNQFIQQRNTIAIVVDEFGGVSGLITLEDILEEIFGEIEDEHDQEEYVEVVVVEGKEYLFSGRLEIDYLNEKYNLSFPEGDYHTLSGYLVMTSQTIPDKDTRLELEPYQFVIEMVSETKIDTVRVIRMES